MNINNEVIDINNRRRRRPLVTLLLLAAVVAPAVSAAPATAAAPPTARVEGQVVAWTSQRPIAGATVSLPDYGLRVVSGSDGRFSFSSALQVGGAERRITAVVTAPGFGRWRVRGLPLLARDTLRLHAELRRHDWSHTVPRREEHLAARRAMATERPSAATGGSTCTGWPAHTVPPRTIRVWISDEQVSKQYDFLFYVRHVLPREWIPSWDADSLAAGAIAVKQYAWFKAMPGHAYTGGTGCADVQDTVADQVFDPTYSHAATDQAAYATFGSTVLRDGAQFLAQYWAGSTTQPCEPVTGTYAGRMSQWGTRTCASQGKVWPAIVPIFYTGAEWKNQGNLLLNPSATSDQMYAWTKQGATSFSRRQGEGYDDAWFIQVTPTTAGKYGMLRQQRPFNGATTTPYQSRVAVRCPTENSGDCAVDLKVIAITSSGVQHVKMVTVTVERAAGWQLFGFNPPSFGVAHAQVAFVVASKQVIAVDVAYLKPPYGGTRFTG